MSLFRCVLMVAAFALFVVSTASFAEETAEKKTDKKTESDAQTDSNAPSATSDATAVKKCDAHGVKKTICARCKPKLASAYKAKGDWCSEHERPESQCAICKPELKKEGVKP